MFIENVQDMNSYPNPRNYVVIENGTPYVVPTGKILAFTALGATGNAGSARIRIDNVKYVTATGDIQGTGVIGGNATSMKLLPPGLRATAGQTVEVTDNTSARAWGYLVDA